MPSSFVLSIPTTTFPVRVTRVRKLQLPAGVGQAIMTLAGSKDALPVSAAYSNFVRAPLGPIARSTGHGSWKLEVSGALEVGESWNLGVLLAHALEAHGRLQEQRNDVPEDVLPTVWATGTVDEIDLRILRVGHIETKLRQALGATPVPDLFLLPPDNLGDVPAGLREELEARGTRILAPATMAEALDALDLPSDWAKEAAPEVAGWRGDPYRGLEAYQAEHRPIFFGRANARAEALERLRTRAERGTSLLVIHGRSGVGKSSLAMAGLLDDVVEQVPARAPFGTAIIRFGDGATPLAALRAGFAQALGLEDISALESSLSTQWLGAWPADTEPSTVLLILDQLEQGLLADEADTIAFGEALATLVRTDRVWVIATLRSDRIDLLERAPALAEIADGDGLYRLVRPTLAELGEIIRAPAKLAGLTFEEGDGLVDLLAEEAMRAPDSLPLLQVTLMRLAAQRDADGRVGMRDYERIKGFSGAVGRLADETVREMEADGISADVLDRTLASLVRIDPDTDRVDARAVDPDTQTAEVQRVLSALVEKRLATASTLSDALDTTGESANADSQGPNDSGRRIRLAHETLIREWPRLHDLAARLRSELALRDRLEDDALRWEQDGRPKGDLIRTPARLTAAEALITDGLATPSQQTCAYIKASREEADRQAKKRQAAADKERRARNRRRFTAAAALVTVVMLVMAGFALNQAQQRQAAQELAQAQLEATRQAEQAAGQAEAAATLQATLAEEQFLRRQEAELAAEQERIFAGRAAEARMQAEEAQARAEEQLEQAQVNQALFLMESGRLMAASNPPAATALITELPFLLGEFDDIAVYHSALEATNEVGLADREISRHVSEDIVNSVAFSPNGRRLLTGSWDHTATVWDLDTGEISLLLSGHHGIVNDADFSPSGDFIVTASSDGTARIWNAITGAMVSVLEGHRGDVESAVFSPDGTLVATGSADGTLRIWDVSTGISVSAYEGHERSVEAVAFSSDGTKLISGSRDETARIWNVETGELVLILDGGQGWVFAVDFSPDDTRVVTATYSGVVQVWDAATGSVTHILDEQQKLCKAAAFSPDGTFIISGCQDGSAIIWDANTGDALVTYLGHEIAISSVAFSPDGRRVATGSLDGSARTWNSALGLFRVIDEGFGEPVWDAAFSPDDSLLAVGYSDGTALVLDVATGDTVVALEGHEDAVAAVTFSPDGSQIVTGSIDGRARVWDALTGRQVLDLEPFDAEVYDVAYSPDGQRIAAASRDTTARVWDATDGNRLLTIAEHENTVFAVAFSPDSALVATGSADRTTRVTDIETNTTRLVLEAREDYSSEIDFSPDGNLIVTTERIFGQIWDVATGSREVSLQGHRSVLDGATFSPDGSRIITHASGSDGPRLWDVKTGSLLLALVGIDSNVTTTSFSSDGALVLAGNWDGAVGVWDVGMPSRELLFSRLPMIAFSSFPEADRYSFFELPSRSHESLFLSSVSNARNNYQWVDWRFENLQIRNTASVWAALTTAISPSIWQDAAARGVPEAHVALSNAFLHGQRGWAQNLESALFHAAIATMLYEALDDEEAAAPMRIRRANLARSLPPATVAALWPRIRDWRPVAGQ